MRSTFGAHFWRSSVPWIAVVSLLCVASCGNPSSGSGEIPAKDTQTASPSGTAMPAGNAEQAPDPGATATAMASSDPAPSESSSAGSSAGAQAADPAGAKAAPSAGPSAVASAEPTASASTEPSAEASAAPALTVQSPATQEATFSVWMSSAKTYKVGQTGYVEAVVVPKGNFHCNTGYPYKVKLNPAPSGVSFPESIVRGASVTEKRAAIRIPFTASAAGDATISGKFYFSVCRDDQCVIDNRVVTASVKIE